MGQRRTVLHVFSGGSIGGAERFVAALAKLGNAGGSIAHGVYVQTPNDALGEVFKDVGGPVFVDHVRGEGGMSFLRNTFAPRAQKPLIDAARSCQASILHAHIFQSHLLTARVGERLGLRTVRTEHHINHWQDATAAPFSRVALKRTDKLIAISQYVLDELRARFPNLGPRAVKVVNGINLEWFAHAPATTWDGVLKLAIASRLEAWKRIHLAIEAVSKVANVSLTIAGSGPEEGRLRSLVDSLALRDRIFWEGQVSDVRQVFANAHVVVSTSEKEPFGLSVAEAQACGRPVVAIAGGGVDEIIENGKTGWLVRDPTPVALARTLERISEQHGDFSVMGQNARTRIENHFDLRQTLSGYEAVYDELLRENSS